MKEFCIAKLTEENKSCVYIMSDKFRFLGLGTFISPGFSVEKPEVHKLVLLL